MKQSFDFESEPGTVGSARRWVRQLLSTWKLEPFTDDACLVASELASNAVVHARTNVRLTLTSDGLDWLRVEVYDENSRMPVLSPSLDDATSGRGLRVVDALASAWGSEHRGNGKVVWAYLGPPPGLQR